MKIFHQNCYPNAFSHIYLYHGSQPAVPLHDNYAAVRMRKQGILCVSVCVDCQLLKDQ